MVILKSWFLPPLPCQCNVKKKQMRNACTFLEYSHDSKKTSSQHFCHVKMQLVGKVIMDKKDLP